MTHPDRDPLHDAMFQLAEEVQIVDLHDRALRTSRHIATRRTVTAAVAGVALVALTAAGVTQVLPKHGTPRPATTATTPAVMVTTPSSSGPAGSGAVSPAPPPAGSAIGALYYVNADLNRPAPIYSWRPAGPAPAKLFTVQSEDDAVLNANVSSDGHWLSYVTSPDPTTNPVDLHLVDLTTGRDRKVRTSVDGMGVEPAWLPGTHRLLVADLDAAKQSPVREVILDADTGATVPLAAKLAGIHATWAADGTAIVLAKGDGTIVVTDAQGRNPRQVPGIGLTAGKVPYSNDIESVSPGGTRVALYLNDGTTPAGDIARGLYCNAVVDTRTGAKVTLPITGQLMQAVFRPDGNLVARVKGQAHNRLVLISPDGRVLDQADEPAALKNTLLLDA